MARVVLVLAMAICIAAINSVAADDAPTPDVSADTVAPQASEETPTPETAAPTPDVSADTEAPQASEETPAPETAAPTPDISADTEAPQGSEETPAPETAAPTPDISGDTAAPQAAQEPETPDISGDTAAPQAAQEPETPDISGDTAAPQGSGETPSPDGSISPPPSTTSAAAQCVRATFTIVGDFSELHQNATEWGLLLEALRRDLATAGITVNSLSANTKEDGSLAVTAGWSSGSNSASVEVLVSSAWLKRVKALYAQAASGDLSVKDVAGEVIACASASSGDLKSASAPVQVVSVAAVAVAAMLWLS
jgi:hypothetical protein